MRARFLNHSTVDILDMVVLCYGCHRAQCKIATSLASILLPRWHSGRELLANAGDIGFILWNWVGSPRK